MKEILRVKDLKMVISINKTNIKEEIHDSTKPIILDVFATWCGPCKYMKPIFEELSQELGEMYKFAQLNVDEARDLAIKYGVTSVPTFVFIKKDQVVGKITGSMSKEDLRAKIKEFLK